jgi:RNA polymerase sigma-70 factor (ECF subfamily)
LQDAWLTAAEKWPVDGWPERPEAWAFTVASRRALDRIRAERRREQREERARLDAEANELDELERRAERWHSGVDDDRLRLIFTCCHPALDLEARIALTLRSVAWLSTEEIATAFGVPTATMAQRLVRAKRKIADAGVPYRVPVGHELPDRLAGVLRVVYLVFNEAYLSRRPDEPVRVDLADEAIRLGRQLAELMPDEPEIGGLLALMLLTHARAGARFDDAGELVLLPDQDRGRWDRALIDEGTAVLEQAMRRRSVGPYQLQAAIQALHDEAVSHDTTDWQQIVALYDLMLRIDASPVIALNRAVAVGFADGAEAALTLIDAIETDGLPGRHLWHAARAEQLLRLGDLTDAATEFDRALAIVSSAAERDHLERRRSTLP